ncbi:MAG: hypothetical protein IJW24_01625 [Clostridia bacterium]|nr:hypothetical protein [Clostridia bacterium]
MKYLDKINPRTKEYFDVLEPEFPEWILDYIETKELLMQQHIGVNCGTIYSKLYDLDYWFSSLDHSIAVALIIWHFTRDKKQTLAGLFHDIATPVFKHCVDFMNGDHETQESTEEQTEKIISESKEIMRLLKRDGIEIDDVDDYQNYPIADNNTPQLSSDRLEYSLSNALFAYKLLPIEDIKNIYEDIEVQKNEHGEIELGFKTKSIARKFTKTVCKLSVIYRQNKTRFSMQFLADLLKRMRDDGLISVDDLYQKTEAEVIDIINSSKYAKVFEIWRNAKRVRTSENAPNGVYFVHCKTKVRYIVPLVCGKRISEICKTTKKAIEKCLDVDMTKFICIPKIKKF